MRIDIACPLAFAFAIALAAAPHMAWGDGCPESYLVLGGVNFPSTASSRDTSGNTSCTTVCPVGCGSGWSASYDLSTGNWSCSSGALGPTGASCATSTHDIFHVTGPTSDTALDFTAILQGSISGSYNTGNGGAAYMDEGPDAFAHGNGVSCGSRCGQPVLLNIQLRHSVGEPFEISTYVGASAEGFCYGDGGANVSASLAFQGLPSGYAVVSCQGFTSSPVVPVRARSWGSLKITYR